MITISSNKKATSGNHRVQILNSDLSFSGIFGKKVFGLEYKLFSFQKTTDLSIFSRLGALDDPFVMQEEEEEEEVIDFEGVSTG